jgi:crotonobetainyl-CoA:carnitine CoA-transferase CaiB-like acyl-CoA transferase
MTALRAADRDGRGQVIDLAIIEPILMLLGGQITAYDQLGILQQRSGNRSVNNAPRNVYRTGDGDWVAVSTSSQSIAERVMRLVGRDDLVAEPWFASGHTRAEHADELDEAVAAWIGARPAGEVLDAFEGAQAAIAPVYDVRGVLADPQYQHIGTVQTVEDDELGPLKMQNVLFRLSATPGAIRWTGRRHGQDTDEVLAEAGVTREQLEILRERGVI